MDIAGNDIIPIRVYAHVFTICMTCDCNIDSLTLSRLYRRFKQQLAGRVISTAKALVVM